MGENQGRDHEQRDSGSDEGETPDDDRSNRFGYPEGEEPMYRDEHGNLLTPEEFRTHLEREETAEEREARFRHAREVKRVLLEEGAEGYRKWLRRRAGED